MERLPTCPKCGIAMVLRTAARGPYAGKQFYGCRNYPKCKEVLNPIPIANETYEEQASKREQDGNLSRGMFQCAICGKHFRTKNGLDWHTGKFHSVEPDQPSHSAAKEDTNMATIRNLSAREKYPGYQVRFIESAALPSGLIEEIAYDGGNSNYLKAFSQWRLDFPHSPEKPRFSDDIQRVLSVAEKILNRGKLVLTSPKLENIFADLFLNNSEYKPNIEALYSIATIKYANQSNNFWLDSPQETKFYDNILPKIINNNYQFAMPQIEMSSLIANGITDIDKRRPDFAIFHPAGDRKIIIEIDGQRHENRREADDERNIILENNDFQVIRIPVAELDNPETSSGIQQISSIFKELIEDEPAKGYEGELKLDEKYLLSCKIAHQIQFTLLQSILFSFMNPFHEREWQICCDIDRIGLFTADESKIILSEAVKDFLELLSAISSLYNVEITLKNIDFCLSENIEDSNRMNHSLNISFANIVLPASTTFYIQNIYFPWNITNAFLTIAAPKWINKAPKESTLRFFLSYIFRKDEFWEGQCQSIVRALQGKDSLILLPTGGGKSLVYQLAALLLPGRALIIDPIISLMEDQMANLASIGIDRCNSITSMSDAAGRKTTGEMFALGEYLFTFVSPERLQIEAFRSSLKGLTMHTPVSIVVIDEAHCVSEWGHDFRTSYLNIGRTTREFCVSNGKQPVLLALTGTASRSVLKDVQRELKIESFDAIITPKSFDRKELKFHSEQIPSTEKRTVLKTYLKKNIPSFFNITSNSLFQLKGKDTSVGLLFCPWVGGEFGVVDISSDISNSFGIHSDFYSGSQPKQYLDERYNDKKTLVTKEFRHNELSLLVCTKSFAMGINKPNIRYTLHINLPPSIESFYQEAGRAGRDRKTAYCSMLISNDDPGRTDKMLNPHTSIEQIAKELKDVSWDDNDDITRIMYFHIRAFRGIAAEKADIREVLMQLGNLRKSEKISITIPAAIKTRVIDNKEYQNDNDARSATEKALHRLLILGVISDYTIEYANNLFTVLKSGGDQQFISDNYLNYVGRYLQSRKESESQRVKIVMNQQLEEFTLSMADILLGFIYDVIEHGRRRALSEMLECAKARDDKSIRERINRYLEWTQFSEELEAIINAKEISFTPVKDMIGNLISPNDASELRGQASRYLESYPDHPALLMLRALSEIQSIDANHIIARQNFIACITSAINKYSVSQKNAFEIASWAFEHLIKYNEQFISPLIIDLLREFPDENFARTIIKRLGKNHAGSPAWFLLSKRNTDCQTLVAGSTLK